MENAEEVLQILERFTKLKQKDIPKELDEYLSYVAKTGDTVFTWSNIKYLFREKLIHVIKDFHDSTSNIDDLPQYPNVDPFNYETMKTALLERLELFNSAPFTIQRICELLTNPKKQYSRIDKYMRALEKNILVVSTIEPGRKQPESENGDSLDSVVISLDVNVDIEMENENIFNVENQRQQNGSNGTGSSNLNNKFDTENNKTHEDVELPSAKKPKLDTNDEEFSKNEKNEVITRKDEKKENENTTKEDDLKNDKSEDVSDSKETEVEKNKEEVKTDSIVEDNTVEKSSEKTEPSETNTKNEEKNETSKETEDNHIPEKENNENHVANENSIEDKLVINENKKTDDPTQEEEDKLLNVDDEQTTKESPVTAEEEKKSTADDDKIPLEENKNKALEDTTAAPTKEDDNLEENDDSNTKNCDSKEEEKRIELFSTDDVVDPSEQPKKALSDTEIDIPTAAEEPVSSKLIDETEEKIELPSEVKNKTSEEEVVIEKQKQMEDMAVEEPLAVPETITPITLDEKATAANITSETIVETTAIPESQAPVDQPMEDPIISDNPVDIETAPVDATPCVEMQAADSNEMATDDVSPAKIDEKSDLAGMDVDDVSQGEAMDQ